MIHEISLPDQGWGDGVEITLIAWLKHAGDQVKAGEVIAEMQSEKANAEIESPITGRLEATLVEEGATVVVGQPIAKVVAD